MTPHVIRGSVTIDANGAGTITMPSPPLGAGEAFEIHHMTTNLRSGTDRNPFVRVNRGPAGSGGTLVDGTRAAALDVSVTNLRIFAGDVLTWTFSRGVEGQVIDAVASGEIVTV